MSELSYSRTCSQCVASCMNGLLRPLFTFAGLFSLALEKKKKGDRKGDAKV